MTRKETIKGPSTLDADSVVDQSPADVEDPLAVLLQRSATGSTCSVPLPGVVIGELVAITENGRTPLVVYPGQPGTAALCARATIDVHGRHIGKPIVLSFEQGNPALPIIIGALRDDENRAPDGGGQVEVDADGERLIVTAKEKLVLRCGEASITLTKSGRIVIDGSYVVSRARGTNRVQGGSVQLN